VPGFSGESCSVQVCSTGLKFSNPAKVLAATPAAYIVCDMLLTPPAGLETRPVSHVTAVGFTVLGLLFVGLALAVVSLVLVFRRSRRTPGVAIVAAMLYFPAVLAEQTGNFSSIHAPAAIQTVELIQAAVAVILVVAAFWTLRRSSSTTNG
jgi:hypothetical protein